MIKTRTYIKIIPSAETVKKVRGLAYTAGIAADDFIADPHTTIIYSKDIVDVNAIVLPKIKFPIIGNNAKFDIFDTKDDGRCLVVVFDSRTAGNLFSKIKSEYNLRTTYDNYKPHITIRKNIGDNEIQLPKISFNLVFDKIAMDNGK